MGDDVDTQEIEPTDKKAGARATDARPALSPGQKAFLRVSGIVAMVLFLLPTFYVVKFYDVDSPRESKYTDIARTAIQSGMDVGIPPTPTIDQLPMLTLLANHGKSAATRLGAVEKVGSLLLTKNISFERPIECLEAKATLAGIAADDKDGDIKAAAQEEIGKIAQGGAVIQR